VNWDCHWWTGTSALLLDWATSFKRRIHSKPTPKFTRNKSTSWGQTSQQHSNHSRPRNPRVRKTVSPNELRLVSSRIHSTRPHAGTGPTGSESIEQLQVESVGLTEVRRIWGHGLSRTSLNSSVLHPRDDRHLIKTRSLNSWTSTCFDADGLFLLSLFSCSSPSRDVLFLLFTPLSSTSPSPSSKSSHSNNSNSELRLSTSSSQNTHPSFFRTMLSYEL